MERQIYKISDKELARLINESVVNYLKENKNDEAFLGIDFGTQMRKENRLNTFKYARLYSDMVQKVQAIANQLNARIQLLQQTQAVNESLVGAMAKGVSRYGLRTGIKAGARVAGKKAFKKTMYAGLAAAAACIAGIPQTITQRLQQFKNPGQTQPKDVINAYSELAEWMQDMCKSVQENPEILGATALQDSTINGPEDTEKTSFITKGQAAGLATSLGLYCMGPVGAAAAVVFDVVDIASSIVRAGAEQDKEGLAIVEKQYQYLNTAVEDMNKALSMTQNPSVIQKASQQTAQNGAQSQQQMTKRQLPNEYVVGRPAPFANSDPQQVQRLQTYFGLQATGKWDRNTQVAWDNWLRNTYSA